MRVKVPKHPVSEVGAAFYHGWLAGMLALGFVFHVFSMWAHWRDRGEWEKR